MAWLISSISTNIFTWMLILLLLYNSYINDIPSTTTNIITWFLILLLFDVKLYGISSSTNILSPAVS